jgi:putative flippase GtrA
LIKTLCRKYRQPFLFCLIGGMNTAVDYLVYSAVLLLSGTRGEVSAALLLAAQTSGIAAGVINSFGMNRLFTFRQEAKSGRAGFQLIRFLLVNALTLSLSYAALWVLTRQGMNPYLAKIPVVPLTMLINYFGYKLFVFRSNRHDRSGTH